MTKKRWLIVGLIVLIAVVGVTFWWYFRNQANTADSDGMTESQVLIMSTDSEASSKEGAARVYQQQLQYKSDMASADEGESIPYYAQLISTASLAGLCDEAAKLTTELEAINIESAFNRYSLVIKCYIDADQPEKADAIRQHMRDNIDKLPESRRDQYQQEAGN